MDSKFLRKMQTMDQFSHDLTLALEETSRSGEMRAGRWGQRRRTRSTGNLPSAPQPTEDSSSSPTNLPNEIANNQVLDCPTNSMLSDSDDRADLRLSLKSRQVGNFESDSLNENFSPARFFRPNTRRKRKFKRIAVEYETTPSTPGAVGENSNNPMFPISCTVKKRVLKHTSQENHRANLFFCGKRKRSHRDRYDHDHGKQHSSSVPRQRDIFTPKNSYQEHKCRTRSFSSTTKPSCERILPLNRSIVSKIEKISAQQKNSESLVCSEGFLFTPILLNSGIQIGNNANMQSSNILGNEIQNEPSATTSLLSQTIMENDLSVKNEMPLEHEEKSANDFIKSSFENTAIVPPLHTLNEVVTVPRDKTKGQNIVNNSEIAQNIIIHKGSDNHSKRTHYRKNKRHHMRAQLQFDDPHSMEWGGIADVVSSSSLSSSDSEAAETNESDREGDDELTDWPGNEAMVTFAAVKSIYDSKRKSGKKSNLPQIKSDDYAPGGDDDTLMSGDEVMSPSGGINFPLSLHSKSQIPQSQPIAIALPVAGPSTQQVRFPSKQIESEMSGETSATNILSSPPCQPGEIREIRAGCRRIREERPGFTIVTSVNERLARFLQDARQTQIRLPDIEVHEHESLGNLAKLYSLQMIVENGCAVLSKTSNTTQSVKIDQPNFSSRFFLSDYKRRCYDGRSESLGGCSQQTTNESFIENQIYSDDNESGKFISLPIAPSSHHNDSSGMTS